MYNLGVLLLIQVDHLSGEDLAWAFEAINMPGVKNRSIIPSMTKKGRMGYLILVDVSPDSERQVADRLLDIFNVYGYHRIKTKHVYSTTRTKLASIVVRKGKKFLENKIHIKRRAVQKAGGYCLENDDLIVLQKEIQEKLGISASLLDLRRKIEGELQNTNSYSVTIRL